MTSMVLYLVSEMMPSCCDMGSNSFTSPGHAAGTEIRRVRSPLGDTW